MSVIETLIEDKMRIFEGNVQVLASTSTPFALTTVQCTSAKFRTNSQDTDNSVGDGVGGGGECKTGRH